MAGYARPRGFLDPLLRFLELGGVLDEPLLQPIGEGAYTRGSAGGHGRHSEALFRGPRRPRGPGLLRLRGSALRSFLLLQCPSSFPRLAPAAPSTLLGLVSIGEAEFL